MSDTRWSRWRWDALCLAIIAVAGLLIGSRYVAAFQQTARADFGQTEFSAAVMLACGRGFAVPVVSNRPLDDFLGGRTDAFSCDQLTPDMQPGVLNFTQRLYRYLMTAVAWQWKWSGISWSRLTPLFGILFAITLAAAYGLFRLAARPLLALAGVVPLAVSAHHLGFLPQLRDYAKAPFILLLILIIARIAMPPLERRRALLLAASFGLVLGIGFGFRNDLLINIPTFVACVVLFLPGRLRDHLWLKGGCLAVALVVFVVSAWPIISGYRSGSNSGHVAVLGLTSAFDPSLGVSRPVYSLGPHYLDGYAATLVNAHGRAHAGPFLDYTHPEYDVAAGRLVADVARNFPADIMIRGLAATLRVLEFPFTVDRLTPAIPRGITASWAVQMYALQQSVLRLLAGVAPWVTLLAIALAGASDWRLGVATGLALVYYAGYPAVQFSARHYFHLEFIAWWSLLFVAARAIHPVAIGRAELRNSAITVLALILLVGLPLGVLRAYQQRHVTALVEGYLQAARVPVTADSVWRDHRAADAFDVRYMVLEFSSERCPAVDVPVTVRYDATTVANDFSYVANVAIQPTGSTLRLVPVFHTGEWSRFSGFEIPEASRPCLKRMSRIADLSGVPLLLDLELTPGWKRTSLFQQIARWSD